MPLFHGPSKGFQIEDLQGIGEGAERESRLRADSPILSPFEDTWNGAIKLTVKMMAMESKHFKMALNIVLRGALSSSPITIITTLN